MNAMNPELASSEPGVEESPSRASLLRRVPWRWSDVLIVLAPPVALRLAPTFIDPAMAVRVPHWAWIPFGLIDLIWLAAWPLWIAHRRLAGWPDRLRARTVFTEGGLALVLIPIIMPLAIGLIVGLNALKGESEIPPGPFEPIMRSPYRSDFVALAVLAVLVAPVAEELFFRGMLYNALRRRLPTVVAAPIQAAAFGLLHPFAAIDMAAVGLIGLALGLFYEWRKTLVAPILMHALINVLGVSVMAAGIVAEANAPKLGVYGERQDGGCRLTQVVPGGPGEAAGLKAGDVVTALDGTSVADIREMAGIIRRKQVGDRVAIDFIRDGSPRRVEADLRPLPQ
jgi:membrane protease YdiL (CAAX protease family)